MVALHARVAGQVAIAFDLESEVCWYGGIELQWFGGRHLAPMTGVTRFSSILSVATRTDREYCSSTFWIPRLPLVLDDCVDLVLRHLDLDVRHIVGCGTWIALHITRLDFNSRKTLVVTLQL